MRAITIPKRGWGRAKTCLQCRRTMKVGDSALVQRYQSNEFWWHRRCIEEVLSTAPMDQGDYLRIFGELKDAAQRGEEIL